MGGTVEGAAAGIDELDVLHFRSMRRALEHHVLKKMREAAAALRFQAEAYFVVDADSDYGCVMSGAHDHFESIGKRGRFDGYIHCGSSLNPAKKRRSFCVILRITEGSP